MPRVKLYGCKTPTDRVHDSKRIAEMIRSRSASST
jgi:hypothetical protein